MYKRTPREWMNWLVSVDHDHATLKNHRGYNKFDSLLARDYAYTLRNMRTTPEMEVAIVKLIWKYRGQCGVEKLSDYAFEYTTTLPTVIDETNGAIS